MYETQFSAWQPWLERNGISDSGCPGVYLIAVTSAPVTNRAFAWSKDVVYVGMTNGKSGLRGRLARFDRTIGGKTGHGGADRARFRYRDATSFRRAAYVTVAPFPCDPSANRPNDLRIMGEVAKFEYECLAYFVEKFGRLPEFNDKKLSPKFSLTVGRAGRRRE